MPLCPPCADADARWRDAPMTVVDGGIRIHTVGVRLSDALDARRHRADRYYALVRAQRDGIARDCAAKHQPATAS